MFHVIEIQNWKLFFFQDCQRKPEIFREKVLLNSLLKGGLWPEHKSLKNPSLEEDPSLTIIPTGSTPPTPGSGPAPHHTSSAYPSLNVELKTEPLPYTGETGHMPGKMSTHEWFKIFPFLIFCYPYSFHFPNVDILTTGEAGAGPGGHGLMMGGYEAGYQAVSYHAGGYEDRGHGGQWPGYHHHHATVAHSQNSPTQRYPYYDSRYILIKMMIVCGRCHFLTLRSAS